MKKKKEGKHLSRSKERIRSQEEKRKAEEPPDWMIDVIAGPRPGELSWPLYVPRYFIAHLGSVLAYREAIDYALKEIRAEETKSKIEKILEKVIRAQYWEEEAFGGHQHKKGFKRHLQATIHAAATTLRKMEDHLEEGYNYGQLGMRQIIRDRIEGIKSILEIKKKRKDASDISAAVVDAVSQIAQLKGKDIQNNDEIGQIILAADLFRGIRCVYEDELKFKPQITKNGLQIESITLGERRKYKRIKTKSCEHFDTEILDCIYSSKGYCGKATERVERIISASR